MKRHGIMVVGGAVLTAGLLVVAMPLVAQQPAVQQSAAHAHMSHVADGFANTPDGAGLLPTALAEAAVARQHAELALRNTTELASMQRHAGHVLHAVDPSRIEQGPGAGYGVVRAASGVAQHIEMAGSHETASENVQLHATHVATAARTATERAERIASLAEEIMATTSADGAAGLLQELADLTEQMVSGVDANGDGRIGWQEGEGGLAQAEQHITLMKRGEGGR
ncbi:MAG: hypothetical protein WD101_02010 [Gemmatimonadota bacterium]